jgi:hypothetical protein
MAHFVKCASDSRVDHPFALGIAGPFAYKENQYNPANRQNA